MCFRVLCFFYFMTALRKIALRVFLHNRKLWLFDMQVLPVIRTIDPEARLSSSMGLNFTAAQWRKDSEIKNISKIQLQCKSTPPFKIWSHLCGISKIAHFSDFCTLFEGIEDRIGGSVASCMTIDWQGYENAVHPKLVMDWDFSICRFKIFKIWSKYLLQDLF